MFFFFCFLHWCIHETWSRRLITFELAMLGNARIFTSPTSACFSRPALTRSPRFCQVDARSLEFFALDLRQFVSMDPSVGIFFGRSVHVLGDVGVGLVLADIAAARIALVQVEQAVGLTATAHQTPVSLTQLFNSIMGCLTPVEAPTVFPIRRQRGERRTRRSRRVLSCTVTVRAGFACDCVLCIAICQYAEVLRWWCNVVQRGRLTS